MPQYDDDIQCVITWFTGNKGTPPPLSPRRPSSVAPSSSIDTVSPSLPLDDDEIEHKHDDSYPTTREEEEEEEDDMDFTPVTDLSSNPSIMNLSSITQCSASSSGVPIDLSSITQCSASSSSSDVPMNLSQSSDLTTTTTTPVKPPSSIIATPTSASTTRYRLYTPPSPLPSIDEQSDADVEATPSPVHRRYRRPRVRSLRGSQLSFSSLASLPAPSAPKKRRHILIPERDIPIQDDVVFEISSSSSDNDDDE